MAPVAGGMLGKLRELTAGRTVRAAAWAVLLFGLLATAWDVRNQMKAVDYRSQAAMWAEIGSQLKHGHNVVALTQDYGSRLAYWGWQDSLIWPNSGDIDYHVARGGTMNLEERFQSMTHGNAFFLVTDFAELNRQPELKIELSRFAIYARGAGYAIYDLQKPVRP